MDHDAEAIRCNSLVARLNALSDWRFTLTLYFLRWAVIAPIALAIFPFVTSDDTFHVKYSPDAYLLPFLVFAPVLETLIECMLPYLIMYKLLGLTLRSPWPFVFVSTSAMVLLHPLVPFVIVMTSITGAFLAYVYIHFAPMSLAKAFLHTAVFHSAINAVGWTMIFIQSA